MAGASNLFALLVIAPFAALFVAGLPEVEPASLTLTPSPNPNPNPNPNQVEPASWLDSLPAPSIKWGTFLRTLALTLALTLTLTLTLTRWGTFLSVMLWNTSGYDAVTLVLSLALALPCHALEHLWLRCGNPDPMP